MINDNQKLVCGLVMPISAIDGCSESHWTDVLEIISEAVVSADFEPNLVSHADDAGIIHKRIIQNLYDNPIVVCDVSGKNPNVMFELGLRLAFDKPTIIVKDDKTSYSFDTAAIEHLEYPRDLRFAQIVEFKRKLAEKIKGTHKKATTDTSYTTFLKHFGEFTVAKLDKKEVSSERYVMEELKNIRETIQRFELQSYRSPPPRPRNRERDRDSAYNEERDKYKIDLCLGDKNEAQLPLIKEFISTHPEIKDYLVVPKRGHKHFLINTKLGSKLGIDELEKEIEKFIESRPEAAE